MSPPVMNTSRAALQKHFLSLSLADGVGALFINQVGFTAARRMDPRVTS